ncbi:MAG TPA: hypothetical protein VGO93_12595 [Candidatus Xenobia bacterium]|jgi:hypothetical protein
MSSQPAASVPKRVGFVTEGPTDLEVLQKLVAAEIGPIVAVSLQPPVSLSLQDSGKFGGGWKGVRQWCSSIPDQIKALKLSGFNVWLKNYKLDALIIHVDADVAGDKDVRLTRPCPPASATTTLLKALIQKTWLKQKALPVNVVLTVPAQSTDCWVAVACQLDSPLTVSPCNECQEEPARLLVDAGYLEKKGGGKVRKQRTTYQSTLAPITLRHWPRVKQECAEAALFASSLQLLRVGLKAKPPKPVSKRE